jgi:quinol monooxygenase YgiN
MWAQLITTRLKPGKGEADLQKLYEELRSVEQPGSGLLRTTAMVDQKDPGRALMFVMFESEEKARAREQDPERQKGLEAARLMIAEIFDGVPEFADLTVVEDATY